MQSEMFQNVLIPVDLSEKHAAAVEAAAGLAKGFGSVVHLLHVIEEIEGSSFAELEDFYTALRGRAEKALEHWRAALARHGTDAFCEIRLGKRGPEILAFAEQAGCDLIILTSHTLEPDQPGRGLATLSHQIALLAPCAVLLVR